MKKNLVGGMISAVLLAVFLLVPKQASANEGIINLRGASIPGACFASSVYVDGNYKILMTCRDLKIALTSEKNIYVAWVEDDGGKQKRLGEIVNGKLATQTDLKFVRIFVTAETSGYGNSPSEDILLTGFVEAINFGPGIVSPPIATPTPSPTPTPTISKGEVLSPAGNAVQETGKSGLGSALSTIFRIALLGFGILLLVVGVFSFLSRKRSL